MIGNLLIVLQAFLKVEEDGEHIKYIGKFEPDHNEHYLLNGITSHPYLMLVAIYCGSV